MTRYVVLLRGVNVGPGKRIAMADFKRILETLGGTDVKTILNSGNAVFSGKTQAPEKWAASIQKAIKQTCGFDTNTLVLTAEQLDAVIDAHPLAQGDEHHSRYIVAFVMDPKVLAQGKAIAKTVTEPEQMAVTKHAVYFWCPDGLLQSASVEAFMKAAKDQHTMRNWATLLKIRAAAAKA